MTNDIIDEYTINNKFNVDAWINDFKPQNYDLVVGWLNSQGNNIHDLKDFILSKVNGQKSSSVSDNSSDTTILSKAKSSFNQLFQLTAYADPNGYGSSESKGRYEWNGWDEGMRELASIRKREGYSDKYINKYNDLLKNKLKIPVSIADYNRIIDLMLNYKKTGQLTVVQELIMKTAAKSIGNIPYYFGGGHPGGGAGERSRVEAEGDKGSFIDANAPDPAMKIPAETFGMTVGTDWFGRTKRGLDCSAYVWFLYASVGACYNETAPPATSELISFEEATNPKPCDLYVKKGHVMIYMGNMKDATQGLNSDATPLFIEEVGTDEVGEYVFKNDNVRLRIGTGFNKDRKQVKAEGYEYKDMSKYYRK